MPTSDVLSDAASVVDCVEGSVCVLVKGLGVFEGEVDVVVSSSPSSFLPPSCRFEMGGGVMRTLRI